MYWFHLGKLKEELAGPGIPEKDRKNYLLALMLTYSAMNLLGMREAGFWEISAGIVEVILMAVSVLLAWKSNGKSSGRDFLDRYLSILWVVYLRVLIVVQVLGIFGMLVTQLTGFSGMLEDYVAEINAAINVLAGLYVTFAVAKHVGQVHAVESSPREPDAVPTAQTAERLEKFVETVVKRELAAAPGVIRTRRPARRSSIRPVRRRR